MLDNELIALLRKTIIDLSPEAEIAGMAVKQAFQPTQQGAESGASVYFYKVGDHRLGTPSKSDKWDEDNQQQVHTELQQYETTFQISVISTQNPQAPQELTASDIANRAAYILQSDACLALLRDQDVGILRVTDIRNPYFTDDRERYEANPSFDVTLTHKQIMTTITPTLISTELRILSV